MNETEHGISIQMRGAESHLHNTPQMLEIIRSEIGDELMVERASILQNLSGLFKMLSDGWSKWVGLTSDGCSYAEALSCNHISNPNKELSIHIFHGEPEQLDITYAPTEPDELIKILAAYLIDRRNNHSRELLNVYPDVVVSLLKSFDRRCKYKHAVNRSIHSFMIVPTTISSNRMGVCLTIIPQSEALAVRSRLPLQ